MKKRYRLAILAAATVLVMGLSLGISYSWFTGSAPMDSPAPVLAGRIDANLKMGTQMDVPTTHAAFVPRILSAPGDILAPIENNANYIPADKVVIENKSAIPIVYRFKVDEVDTDTTHKKEVITTEFNMLKPDGTAAMTAINGWYYGYATASMADTVVAQLQVKFKGAELVDGNDYFNHPYSYKPQFEYCQANPKAVLNVFNVNFDPNDGNKITAVTP